MFGNILFLTELIYCLVVVSTVPTQTPTPTQELTQTQTPTPTQELTPTPTPTSTMPGIYAYCFVNFLIVVF